ncbi:hypothetical protein BDZ94DRAFT_1310037 [Collybia nuda]|uniref:Uncharacterized protein n=1 Tax=Collybia nuda TaxID=64659 RepID=A0A9P5Y677_9AGAR|nr:hypothetical protein BDZ94DRAFT_1310037 [Collybia nuda]
MTSKPDKIPAKPPPARGRTPVSKPLSTASTRAKQVTTTKPASVAEKKPLRTPGASTTTQSLKVSEKPTRNPPNTRTPATNAKPRVNITKSNPPSTTKPGPSASTSGAKYSPPLSATPPVSTKEQGPTPTSDPLQVAAQLYPWMYMTSTLEACFQTAEEAARKDLEARAKLVEEEESEIADQRIRFEAERAADLYDELATDLFAKEAPSIMQTFMSHGDACAQLEAEALQLATQGAIEPDEDAPLQVYNEMLDNLDTLHTEAVELESSILRLTSQRPDDQEPTSENNSTARSQILSVFAACLPVLRARISNLSMAQDLIDGAQENLSISLRMESLGLLD